MPNAMPVGIVKIAGISSPVKEKQCRSNKQESQNQAEYIKFVQSNLSFKMADVVMVLENQQHGKFPDNDGHDGIPFIKVGGKKVRNGDENQREKKTLFVIQTVPRKSNNRKEKHDHCKVRYM